VTRGTGAIRMIRCLLLHSAESTRGSIRRSRRPPLPLRARVSVELGTLCRLIQANSPNLDLRARIRLGSHRSSRHATQHRELPDVCKCIRDRSLKDLSRGASRLALGEPRIHACKCGEDAIALFVPGQTTSRSPSVFTIRQPLAPFSEVAYVAEYR